MSECLSNPMCQCGCDDYQPGTRDPRTGALERRERYAAAMWPYVAGKSAHMDEAADAAMAVADAEAARLRAELSEARADVRKARWAREQEAATIARVRSVLDEWYGTSDASALSAEIRAALEGEQ